MENSQKIRFDGNFGDCAYKKVVYMVILMNTWRFVNTRVQVYSFLLELYQTCR